MMYYVEREGRRYAQFERLRHAPGLVHAFAMRPLDVSIREDARAAERAARREQMARDWRLDPARVCACVQVHEARIAVVEAADAGAPLVGVDAVATRWPDTPLMTFSADCPLILLFDPRRAVLGLVPASWRWTVARLAARLVATLHERYGCEPADLQAGVGPAAGPCCYEVQADVYEAARELPDRERLFPRRAGRLYFDLWEANRALLVEAGVRSEHVEVAGVCTMCRNDLFYSFPQEGPGCGHFGLMAARVERGPSEHEGPPG
jgi:hypothetical protein